MPDHLTEPEEQSRSRSRSTGPRTPEGKARSSQNRLTHGVRSEKTVLRTESKEAFDANMQLWLDRYPTEDDLIRLLVIETAKAYWFLLRAQKRLEDVEFELPGNAYHWIDAHQQLLTNFFRYKTAAERAFLRFLKELDQRVAATTPPPSPLRTDHAPLPTDHSSPPDNEVKCDIIYVDSKSQAFGEASEPQKDCTIFARRNFVDRDSGPCGGSSGTLDPGLVR